MSAAPQWGQKTRCEKHQWALWSVFGAEDWEVIHEREARLEFCGNPSKHVHYHTVPVHSLNGDGAVAQRSILFISWTRIVTLFVFSTLLQSLLAIREARAHAAHVAVEAFLFPQSIHHFATTLFKTLWNVCGSEFTEWGSSYVFVRPQVPGGPCVKKERKQNDSATRASLKQKVTV